MKIQRNGANLIIWDADGSRRYAVAAPGGIWYVTGEPPTPPPAGFAWPFPLNQVSTEWEGYPGHKGIDFDFAAVDPAPIKACAAGVVEYSGWYQDPPYQDWWGWGNMVVINHGAVGVNGEVLRTLYAHMRYTPDVSVNDAVVLGQQLGVGGDTGLSFGDHLHLETSIDGMFNQINPRDFMAIYNPTDEVVP